MAITVTKPVDEPTNLQSQLQVGGSLDPNTTYYFVVIGYAELYLAPTSYTVHNYHSDLSAEGQFTTTTTDLSAHITWDNAVGANYYEILVSKVSGDYTQSYSREALLQTLGGTITDGAVGYTVSTYTGSLYVVHTAQYTGTFSGGIGKHLGILKADFSGSDIHDMDDLYNAIVAAGFSEYVHYDGYNFIYKGWITCSLGIEDDGEFAVHDKHIQIIKGGIHARGLNYKFTFGKYVEDRNDFSYYTVVSIDILNARYPFRAVYLDSDTLRMYGGILTMGNGLFAVSRWNDLADVYYIGNGQGYFAGDVSGLFGPQIGIAMRGQAGTLRDTAFGQGNNFSSYPVIRCKIWQKANFAYRAGHYFIGCTWAVESWRHLSFYGGSHVGSGYYTDLYDNYFPHFNNQVLNTTELYVGLLNETYGLVTDHKLYLHFTLNMKVIDELGNPVEGVLVDVRKPDGDSVLWSEIDGTTDRQPTGNTFTTPRQTDSNGEIDMYVRSYWFYHDPQPPIVGNSYGFVKVIEYPITVTFSKNGYRSYSVIVHDFNAPVTGVVTLETGVRDYKEQIISADLEEDIITGKI